MVPAHFIGGRGLDALGLKPGDHIVTVLQNRQEAATLHWACQFVGIIITPVNWRATADDLDFFCDGRRGESADPRRRIGRGSARLQGGMSAHHDGGLERWLELRAPDAQPRENAEAWSVMLYTSGTTARPKGVPRRQRAERAAALAHVAQNMYGAHERTLGVMPLYHTMGVRSLLAMSLIGGAFVCLPRFDAGRALELIAAEKITNLYLVPTLYHDVLHHPGFASADVSSRAQARLRRRLDDRRAAQGADRGIPAGPVRQPLRLVGDLHLHHRPGRAGETRLGRTRRHQSADPRGEARRDLAR